MNSGGRIRGHIFGSYGDWGSYVGRKYSFAPYSLRTQSDVPKNA